jgi:Beta-galactosidase
VGLNANTSGWGGASTGPRIDRVTSQTQTKWLREEFLWSTIQPSSGTFDFSYYDHYMLLAAQRGLHILAVLDGAPSWAGATSNTIPTNPTAYAAYVSAVIKRYGTNGTFWQQNPTLKASTITTWELWNEPYYATNYDPASYAKLVKAAGTAGHAADPSAKLLIGAEMQSARNASGDWVWWADALYQAVPDLNNYFDAVAIHPYGTDLTGYTAIVSGQGYANYDRLMRAQDLHQQFLNHGASGKRFWFTEIGYSTCGQAITECVTAAQQSADMTTLFNDVHNSWSSWVQAVFAYNYTDNSSQPQSVFDGYGLTTDSGSAKPALAVFQKQAAASAG